MDDALKDLLFEVPELPGTPIGKRLTLLEADGVKAIFMGNVAINVFDASDRAAESACIAMLSGADLASDIDIAEAFHCHRNTVARLAGRLCTEGMAAVVPAKRGPKGPSKVTPEVRRVITDNRRLSTGTLTRLIRRETGVTLSVAYVGRLRSEPRPHQPRLVKRPRCQNSPTTTEPKTTKTEEPDQATPSNDNDVSGDASSFDPPATLPEKGAAPVEGPQAAVGMTSSA